jgi:hypothetical protein
LDIQKDMAADFIAMEDETCTEDYITIEGSTSTCSLIDTSNRYCGQILADAATVKNSIEICGKFPVVSSCFNQPGPSAVRTRIDSKG